MREALESSERVNGIQTGREPEVRESLKDDVKENIRANSIYRQQQAASKTNGKR